MCVFFQVRESVEELSRAILTIEGTGDKAEAEDLLLKYAIMTPELQRTLTALDNVQVTAPFICHITSASSLNMLSYSICLLFVQVPVDIAPSFRVLDKLTC